MCGILAAFSASVSDLDDRFTTALDLMTHRGPDDHGIKAGEGYLLGHRRLSILDLRHSAAQPMSSRDGKVTIIFNGEVYNFAEIRKELEDGGSRFQTNSDTEVILEAYVQIGERCVEQFIGMFSIVIVDERRSQPKVLVIRDRLGIKPLYYYQHDGILVFSSEIKSILHLASSRFKLNKSAISSYLSFRYPILSDTFFEGIKVVPPASIISVREARVESISKYWDLSEAVGHPNDNVSEEEWLEKLDEVFSSAVRYRMISDVPVGAYLSGGVDSSLVVAKMSESTTEQVKTFTIGFENEGYNEFDFSRVVADQYNTIHKEILIDSSDYFLEMERLIAFKDAPLSVPNEIPLYLMSLELKKYITVVLSGEGADEIFGGYGRIFRSADDLEKLSRKNGSKRLAAALGRKYGANTFQNQLDHFYWNYCYIKPELKLELLSREEDWVAIEGSLKGLFDSRFADVADASYVEKMMYAFETVHLQGLLNRVDTTTMAASVEARVPFVDHRLVELAFQVPPRLKLKWKDSESKEKARNLVSDDVSETLDIPKYILKKYGERYLPDDILYRRKMGFPVPLDVWFRGQFVQTARRLINDEGNPAFSAFDMPALNNFIDRKVDSHADALKIWMILNVFVFCSVFRDSLE